MKTQKPEPRLETCTLWDYPSQNYGPANNQGNINYKGATPSHVIWNLLYRYSRKNDLIVDTMAGSGTTMDVARDLKRRALGYDINPIRSDIFRADARNVPLENEKADFVFIDPPYGDHLMYSNKKGCIGKLPADTQAFFIEMNKVFRECHRILKNNRYMAVFVSDSYKKGSFVPIGFEFFRMLSELFIPTDIVCVKRYNAKLNKKQWHRTAIEKNFFLRGFNYLFIFAKLKGKTHNDRREHKEIEYHINSGFY